MLLSHIYQVTIFTFSYQVWVHYFTLLLLFLLLMFPKSLHIVVDSTHFNFHGQRSNDATKSVPQGIIFYEYHCVCLGHTQMYKWSPAPCGACHTVGIAGRCSSASVDCHWESREGGIGEAVRSFQGRCV